MALLHRRGDGVAGGLLHQSDHGRRGKDQKQPRTDLRGGILPLHSPFGSAFQSGLQHVFCSFLLFSFASIMGETGEKVKYGLRPG